MRAKGLLWLGLKCVNKGTGFVKPNIIVDGQSQQAVTSIVKVPCNKITPDSSVNIALVSNDKETSSTPNNL